MDASGKVLAHGKALSDPDADVRTVDPLLVPRRDRDLMSDEFYLESPQKGRRARNTARTLGTDGD